MAERADLYIADRNAGMTYREIGKKYGISHQRVHQVCTGKRGPKFRPYKPEECIYPNLRRWLNENEVNRSEFVRRMEFEVIGNRVAEAARWFTGERYPYKKSIDKMLAVTGLTYEELFWEGDGDA
jgi:transcriptional regulator with XRE-family HTH domain